MLFLFVYLLILVISTMLVNEVEPLAAMEEPSATGLAGVEVLDVLDHVAEALELEDVGLESSGEGEGGTHIQPLLLDVPHLKD